MLFILKELWSQIGEWIEKKKARVETNQFEGER